MEKLEEYYFTEIINKIIQSQLMVAGTAHTRRVVDAIEGLTTSRDFKVKKITGSARDIIRNLIHEFAKINPLAKSVIRLQLLRHHMETKRDEFQILAKETT